MELETRKISLKVVIIFTDKAVFSNTGKHLSNIEVLVLQETLKDKKYPEIASSHGYTIEYLKNDVGPKLWRRLSYVFGEKVNKANVKIVLQHRLYNEQEKIKSVTVRASVPEPKQISPDVPSQQPPKQPLSSPPASSRTSSESQLKQLEKFAQNYFEKSLKSLQGTCAHQILMALAMFPDGAVQEAIIKVTELKEPNLFADSVTQLQQMLLIEQREQKYYLPPVAQSYIVQELTSHPKFERETRERWVSWYLEMSESSHSLTLEKEKKNLAEVMDWCMTHHLYSQVNQLWPIFKSYLGE